MDNSTDRRPGELPTYSQLNGSNNFLRILLPYKPKGSGRHCQSTKEKSQAFLFQATMMTLNLYLLENHWLGKTAFSLQDIKTDYFNAQWLQAIISNLDLNAESIKMHPNYPKLLRMGKMAT